MLILTVFLVLLVAVACDSAHEHTFSDWENISDPTCTSFGLKKRSCACGENEYDTVKALSHTPITDAAVPASCTAPGKTEGSHCKDCGAVIEKQTETAVLAHGFSSWENISEPTCTSIGIKKRSCTCGAFEYDMIEALSHTPVTDAAVLATCTDPGKTEGSHCGTCGTILVAQNTVIPTGHKYDDVTVLEEALCNLDGTKRFTCTNRGCSAYYDESYALPAPDSSEIYADAVQYTGVLQCFDRFGNLMEEASAFVISADGKIVTSNKRIDNAFSLVFSLGGNYYDVTEVLAYDSEKNIAVLKVNASDLPCATLCKQDPVNAETVYMVGAPDSVPSTMSSGVVSNSSLEANGIRRIQHDITWNDGYAGGPLINRFGEVIGISTGYIGENHLGLATPVTALDSLDYSSPMSVYEYGNETFTPAEQLDYWVQIFHTEATEEIVAYVVQGEGFQYALGYNTEWEYSFIDGYWKKEEGYEYSVRVIFNNSNGTYQYNAAFVQGAMRNDTVGFIDAATYTESTVLIYDTFYGRFWNEAELMALYSSAVYDTLAFFSHCLDTYFDTLTLEDFGFAALSFDRDETALDQLNAFVINNGSYDESTGSYVLTMDASVGEDPVILIITHRPAGENTLASTVVTIGYFAQGGRLFRVSISLDPVEEGNRFELLYAIFGENEYVTQSRGWGYLDAGFLTSYSQLTCYEFEGMNEYEDGLMKDYTFYLYYLMDLLNYVLADVNPALSIKDLGFYLYFG